MYFVRYMVREEGGSGGVSAARGGALHRTLSRKGSGAFGGWASPGGSGGRRGGQGSAAFSSPLGRARSVSRLFSPAAAAAAAAGGGGAAPPPSRRVVATIPKRYTEFLRLREGLLCLLQAAADAQARGRLHALSRYALPPSVLAALPTVAARLCAFPFPSKGGLFSDGASPGTVLHRQHAFHAFLALLHETELTSLALVRQFLGLP